MKSFILFIVITCGIALALALSASNDQLVTVNYLIAQDSIKLSYLLLGAFVSGIVFTGACFSLVILKLRISVRRMKHKNKRQLVELDKLRMNVTKD